MAENIIPSDQPSQLDIVESLSTLEQKAIVRPNNPPPGIAGFLFDIPGDEWVELNSQITDHYTELNTSIQDNIALEPERVTLRGVVAELTNSAPVNEPTSPVTDPLPDNVPLTPPLTEGSTSSILSSAGIANLIKTGISSAALGVLARKAPGVASLAKAFGPQIIAGAQGRIASAVTSAVRTLQSPTNAAALQVSGVKLPNPAQVAVGVIKSVVPKFAGSVINALKTLGNPNSQQLIGGTVAQASAATNTSNSLLQVYEAKQPTPPRATRQSSAFLYFYALWKGRQLCSVETPWGIWANMAIASIRAEQAEGSKYATEFTVVFKKVRIAETVTVQLGQLAGRNAFQSAASTPTQNGNVGQTEIPTQEAGVINRSWLYQAAEAVVSP